MPNYEPTKHSLNRNGIIKAYAANTNQGIVRDYNEDRVSIILNIVKPLSRGRKLIFYILQQMKIGLSVHFLEFMMVMEVLHVQIFSEITFINLLFGNLIFLGILMMHWGRDLSKQSSNFWKLHKTLIEREYLNVVGLVL